MVSFVEIEFRQRDKEWSMSELQCHDYYELYFLIEGKREFFYESKMYNISERTLCVIPPFYMHKTAGGSYKRININISSNLLTEKERAVLDSLAVNTVFSLDAKSANLIY